MPATKNAISPDKAYQVVEVTKINPPDGVDEGNWYRYEIALEGETIVGSRRGTLQQVTQYANECASNMSERVARGRSSWASRNKQKDNTSK